MEKKLDDNYTACELYWISPRSNTLQSSSSTTTYLPSQKLSKLDELDMRDTAGEVRANSQATYMEEMDTATRVQILNETDCISHRTNTLGKGKDPIILPPTMVK